MCQLVLLLAIDPSFIYDGEIFCSPGYGRTDASATCSSISSTTAISNGVCIFNDYDSITGGSCMKKCPQTSAVNSNRATSNPSIISYNGSFCQLCNGNTYPDTAAEFCASIDSITENCDYYDFTTGKCSQCATSYILTDSNTCILASTANKANCLAVLVTSGDSPSYTCTQCQNGYLLISGVCVEASERDCEQTNGIVCKRCFDGFRLIQVSQTSAICVATSCSDESKLYNQSISQLSPDQCTESCEANCQCYGDVSYCVDCISSYYNAQAVDGATQFDENGAPMITCAACNSGDSHIATCRKATTADAAIYTNTVIIESCATGFYLKAQKDESSKITLSCVDLSTALPNCVQIQASNDSEGQTVCLKCNSDSFLFQGHCFAISGCHQNEYYISTVNDKYTVQCRCYLHSAYFLGVEADIAIVDGNGNYVSLDADKVKCVDATALHCMQGHVGSLGKCQAECLADPEFGLAGLQCAASEQCDSGFVLNTVDGACIPEAKNCGVKADIVTGDTYEKCTTCDDYFGLVTTATSPIVGKCVSCLANNVDIAVDVADGETAANVASSTACKSCTITSDSTTTTSCGSEGNCAVLGIFEKDGKLMAAQIVPKDTDYYLITVDTCTAANDGFYVLSTANAQHINVGACNAKCATCALKDGDNSYDIEPSARCLACATNYAKSVVYAGNADESALSACVKVEKTGDDSNGYTCGQQSPLCEVCSARQSNPFCRVCSADSYFFQGACVKIANCPKYIVLEAAAEGESATVSCQCADGYYLGKVTDEVSGVASAACVACTGNCDLCSGSTEAANVQTVNNVKIATSSVCTTGTCKPGYDSIEGGVQCYEVPKNCPYVINEAGNGFKCNGCNNNYGKKTDTECTKCTINYCTACDNSGKSELCTKCSTERVVSADNKACNIGSCPVGFYLNNAKCTRCPVHAKSCSSTAVSGCDTGYYANGNKCIVCTTGMTKCSLTDGSTTTFSNVECAEGYLRTGEDNDQKCTACPAGCKHCSSTDSGVTTTCTASSLTDCMDGYFYTEVHPETGVALSAGVCYKVCPTQTIISKDGVSVAGFYHHSVDTCVQCQVHGCAQCKDGKSCLPNQCLEGYIYQEFEGVGRCWYGADQFKHFRELLFAVKDQMSGIFGLLLVAVFAVGVIVIVSLRKTGAKVAAIKY